VCNRKCWLHNDCHTARVHAWTRKSACNPGRVIGHESTTQSSYHVEGLPPNPKNPSMSMASKTQKSYHVDGLTNAEFLLCRWHPKHRNPPMSMAAQNTEILLCRWPPKHKIPIISMALQTRYHIISMASKTQKSIHVQSLPNAEVLICRWLPKQCNPPMSIASNDAEMLWCRWPPNTQFLLSPSLAKQRNPIMSMASKTQQSKHDHDCPIYRACITCNLTFNLLMAYSASVVDTLGSVACNRMLWETL
jgi:hypothetical protein